MSTIELKGVTKHFGAFTAVKNVSLDRLGGRGRLPAGSVGMRQDDDLADHRGA